MRRHWRVTLLALVLAACQAAPVAAPIREEVGPPPSSPAIAVGDDRVRPLVGGPAAFAAVAAALERARERVEVEMYEFQRVDLADRLVAAQARGAQVTVILDAQAVGTAETLRRLRAAGIQALDYPAERRAIDHVKLLLVDRAVAIVGGINWGLASEQHRDYAAEVRGPVVAHLARVFARDLAAAGRPVAIPPVTAEGAVRVLTTRPAHDIETAVLSLLAAATQRIDAELFALTAPAAVSALQAAQRRGVQVRVLLDSNQDALGVRATLAGSGIRAAYYAGPGKLHAKIVVVDSARVLLGSANWTHGGFATNHELDLAIDHPAVAAVYAAAIAHDWDVRPRAFLAKQVLACHQLWHGDPEEVQERWRDVA
jgi:phosphatidylserine/phosphatidylglycerophosphate/cardiolipin synthase-like enzyme